MKSIPHTGIASIAAVCVALPARRRLGALLLACGAALGAGISASAQAQSMVMASTTSTEQSGPVSYTHLTLPTKRIV